MAAFLVQNRPIQWDRNKAYLLYLQSITNVQLTTKMQEKEKLAAVWVIC